MGVIIQGNSKQNYSDFMPCKDCGNPIVENQDTGLCASCGASRRKAERLAQKPIKTYRIPKVSLKSKDALKTYSQKRKEHLKKHPYCQIKLQGCTQRASQIHHSAKRGANLNKEETFLSACENCHNIVERVLSAAERRKLGLLK
jgi:uncharacterized Zn finger protein (UPF0148 family)